LSADTPRILELRRRVHADPASIAFAQLAEECRRAGAPEEAVGICRAGLGHHPGYLSARVTLGRALIELGSLDEAAVELNRVVQQAPGNLAAIRGLAEIHQQRGDIGQALTHYQRALELARVDPELENSIELLSQAVAPSLAAPTPAKGEDLFDFDSLLRQFGETQPLPEAVKAPPVMTSSAIQSADLSQQPPDVFANVERELRARAEQRAAADKEARRQLLRRRDLAMLAELDEWLSALAADRRTPDPA